MATVFQLWAVLLPHKTWLHTLIHDAGYEPWEHQREILQWFISHLVKTSLGANPQLNINRDDSAFLVELLKRMLKVELSSEAEDKILDEMSSLQNLNPEAAQLIINLPRLEELFSGEDIRKAVEITKKGDYRPEILIAGNKAGGIVISSCFEAEQKAEVVKELIEYLSNQDVIDDIFSCRAPFFSFWDVMAETGLLEESYNLVFHLFNCASTEQLLEGVTWAWRFDKLDITHIESLSTIFVEKMQSTGIMELKQIVHECLPRHSSPESIPVFLSHLALSIISATESTDDFATDVLKVVLQQHIPDKLKHTFVNKILLLPKELLIAMAPQHMTQLEELAQSVGAKQALEQKLHELSVGMVEASSQALAGISHFDTHTDADGNALLGAAEDYLN